MTANSVIAGVLVARLLGAEALGIYLVLAAAIQILIQTSNFGLALANTYFTAREPAKLVPAAMNSVIFAFVSGGVGAMFVLFLSSKFIPNVPRDLALVGLAVVPFQLITSYLQNLLLAQNEVKRFNFLDLINQSFVLLNAIVALLIFGSGLWLLVTLNSVAGFAIAVLAAAILYRYVRTRFPEAAWKSDLAIMPPMLAYAFKLFVFAASTFLVYRLDLFIVNYYRGSVEAAVYAVATQCSMFLLLLPHVVSHLLQARVSATQDEGGKFTARVARHTSLLLFVACIASIPGTFLVKILYGKGFEELPIQLWILLPGVFFIGIQSVLSQYFVGTGSPSFLSIVWIAALFVNVALNLATVPQYGAYGAATVSTICYAAVSLAVYLRFSKITGLGLIEFILPKAEDLSELTRLLKR
jgi:O-antigen/teichoic acid export membrane protein